MTGLLVDREDGIAIVTFHRPAALNALDLGGDSTATQRAGNQERIVVVVFHQQNSKIFGHGAWR